METRPPQHQHFASTSNMSILSSGNPNAATSKFPGGVAQQSIRLVQVWKSSHEKVLWCDSGNSLSAMTRSAPFYCFFHSTHPITQSINVIENPHFRELLLFLAQGRVTDDEIPGRTCMTESILKTWKTEREAFYQEMKVCQVCSLC